MNQPLCTVIQNLCIRKLPAVTQYCPAGLQFDLKLCVCNYPQDTVCPYNCPVSYQAPAYSKGKINPTLITGLIIIYVYTSYY